MTPQMLAFLSELRDLMIRHDIRSLEAVENTRGFYLEIEGIEVEIDGKWDDDGEPVRSYCSVNIGRYIDVDGLTSLLARSERDG